MGEHGDSGVYGRHERLLGEGGDDFRLEMAGFKLCELIGERGRVYLAEDVKAGEKAEKRADVAFDDGVVAFPEVAAAFAFYFFFNDDEVVQAWHEEYGDKQYGGDALPGEEEFLNCVCDKDVNKG